VVILTAFIYLFRIDIIVSFFYKSLYLVNFWIIYKNILLYRSLFLKYIIINFTHLSIVFCSYRLIVLYLFWVFIILCDSLYLYLSFFA